MSVDQRPARVKIYSSGQPRASEGQPRDDLLGELIERRGRGKAQVAPVPVPAAPQRNYVMAWVMLGIMLFIAGCGIGGALMVFRLLDLASAS